MTTETLPQYPYVIEEERASVIDPSQTLTVEVGIICPKCKKRYPITLPHGSSIKCSCGLFIIRQGAGLTCTLDD